LSDTPDHLGHRERLRERFLTGGAGALPDYEMLELLLFMAQSRRDMKPLAKRLMARFGTYANVISATPEELRSVEGVGESVVATLKIVRDAAVRLGREELTGRTVLSSWQDLLEYCRATMGRNTIEQFRIFFLDRKNAVITDEVQQEGTVDHTAVYPREVVKRALELNASAIIMAHNHPSGDTTPSRGDIEMTRMVKEACEKIGIALHDHVVVSKSSTTSFRSLGLI
jgi:DNA repair protein RadC